MTDVTLAVFADSNTALREFLLARNPKQQHSATLESYMIKPIQRILKYPLLLQQLCLHACSGSEEHHHLTGLTATFVFPATSSSHHQLHFQSVWPPMILFSRWTVCPAQPISALAVIYHGVSSTRLCCRFVLCRLYGQLVATTSIVAFHWLH